MRQQDAVLLLEAQYHSLQLAKVCCTLLCRDNRTSHQLVTTGGSVWNGHLVPRRSTHTCVCETSMCAHETKCDKRCNSSLDHESLKGLSWPAVFCFICMAVLQHCASVERHSIANSPQHARRKRPHVQSWSCIAELAEKASQPHGGGEKGSRAAEGYKTL